MVQTWPYEVPITVFLQNLGKWLEPIMAAFSFLGNELFFLVVMTGLYWCINSSLGIRVGLALLSTASLNSWLKSLFHGSRPYWFSDTIDSFSQETSFGFPSGHSQSAVVVWGRIASWIKRTWTWMVAILLIFLIGLSRIYLGVHWTTDVLFGWLIGIIFLIIFKKLEKPVSKWWLKHKYSTQVLLSFLSSFIMIAISVILIKNWAQLPFNADWKTTEKLNVIEAGGIIEMELEREVLIDSFKSAFSNAGIWFGMLAGISMIKKLGGFTVPKAPLGKLLSYLLGLAGVLALYFGLKQILPSSFHYYNLLLRYFQYALIGLWISMFAPTIFIKLGWATKE